MHSNTPSDPSRTVNNSRSSICEPLQSRIDHLAKPSQSRRHACQLSHSANLNHCKWDVPLFARTTLDAALTPNAQEKLIPELHAAGLGWLSARKTDQRLARQLSSEAKRVVPIHLDEPIDVESLENAMGIELQLYGLPFQSIASSRRARWTPNLPIEISDLGQLAMKVELLRQLTQGRSAVGAAISAGSPYDDVRVLTDSGFDYLCLIVDVQYELSAGGSLRLAPLEWAVEQALNGIKDSGSNIKLLVSANITSPDEMFRWLRMGVDALSVDAFLAQHKPQETAPARETYGSVLSLATPQVSTFAWARTSISKLSLDLQDCYTFASH